MKFKFALEKLLHQRTLQVNLDRRHFLDKKNELDQETQKLNEMIILKEKTIAHRGQQVENQDHWQNEVQMINSFLTGQDLRIEKQTQRLKKLEKEVELLRQILLKALTEARMVERLKEKKKEVFIKEALEKEQKELDEIGSIGNRNQAIKNGLDGNNK